jgi:hypothetical protein
MKVKVKDSIQENFIGFFNHARRRPGDVFTIPDEPKRELFPAEKKLLMNEDGKAQIDAVVDKDGKVPQLFSFRWMEPVEPNTSESVSTAQGALTVRTEHIAAEKAAALPARKAAATAGAGGGDQTNQDVL